MILKLLTSRYKTDLDIHKPKNLPPHNGSWKAIKAPEQTLGSVLEKMSDANNNTSIFQYSTDERPTGALTGPNFHTFIVEHALIMSFAAK